MADFLTGSVTTFSQNAPGPLDVHVWYVGAYAQDTWKVTPRLTASYGLRWEPFLPQQAVNGKIYHFDYDAFSKGVKTQQFTKAPPGVFYPGDPGFPSKAGLNKHWAVFGLRFDGAMMFLPVTGRSQIHLGNLVEREEFDQDNSGQNASGGDPQCHRGANVSGDLSPSEGADGESALHHEKLDGGAARANPVRESALTGEAQGRHGGQPCGAG